MNNTPPFCSIVILNYLGEKVIAKTVNAVLHLDYPKDKYEIIIVDNGSRDGSRKILKKIQEKYTNVQLINLTKNYGFAAGNNYGIRKAQGKYIALLNNDCFVDRNWLKELVKVAEKKNNLFAISSRILLYPNFFYVNFKNSIKFQENSFYLVKSNLLRFSSKIKLAEKKNKTYYEVEIPYDLNDFAVEISFQLQEIKPGVGLKILKLRKNDYILSSNNNLTKIKLNVKSQNIIKNSFDKIQNAGTIVFQDGTGRDIGAIVRNQSIDYEKDYGQYNLLKENYAACGAAVLINRKILEEVGYLDESFFMYYEDVEISERARFMGYKIFYCPRAVVRHLHAFSSKEGSKFFQYHANLGRLLHLFFHYPKRVFVREYIKYSIWSSRRLIKNFFDRESLKINTLLFNVTIYFLKNLPFLFIKRALKLKKYKKDAVSLNFKEIIGGNWYFK
ncbi:glycosyltransferase [Candidatus Daviesbacteria bacterium]|nr:glycosyltransferase [Candidatus Daviesbacteria bacterium]